MSDEFRETIKKLERAYLANLAMLQEEQKILKELMKNKKDQSKLLRKLVN